MAPKGPFPLELLPSTLFAERCVLVNGRSFHCCWEQNSPKENSILAWMFTSGLTGLLFVHINDRVNAPA